MNMLVRATTGLLATSLAALAAAQAISLPALPPGATYPTLNTNPMSMIGKVRYSDSHVVVAFHAGVRSASQISAIRSLGLRVKSGHQSPYFSLLELSADARRAGITVEMVVAELNRDPRVRYAEFDPYLEPDAIPNDPRFNEMWGLHNTGQSGGLADADVDAVEAWDRVAGAPTIVVAVTDDGVDYNHPDLAPVMWSNTDEIGGNGIDDDANGFIDDVRGWDFSDNDSNPIPAGTDSHGTHCAGTVGAVHNNGIGVTGMGPNIRLMPLRMYGGAANFLSALANAIDYARLNGARVISTSYNIDGYGQALVDAILRARSNDVAYVNSAGNNSQNNPPRQAIRTVADNVIFVASTTRTDTISSFSNTGTLVEIAAPGSDILSTLPNNSYGLNSGTSMATPHVAGALGVVRSMRPTLTARQALDVLISTADRVSTITGPVNGGRLNLNNALEEDNVAPAALTTFSVTRRAFTGVIMQMSLSGDDGMTGQASRYDFRVSTAPITAANFTAARAINVPTPSGAAGTLANVLIPNQFPGEAIYIAARAIDNLGNVSPISQAGPIRLRTGLMADRTDGTDRFANTGTTWGKTNVNPFSGATSWTDSPTGNYANNANQALTQSAGVTVAGPSAVVFMTRHDLEANQDYLNVESSTDNGTTWTTVGRITGTSTSWRGVAFALPTTNGQSVRVRFRLTSNASVVRDGAYVDDIAIVPMTSIFFDNMEGAARWTGTGTFARVTTQAFSPTQSWHESPAGNYVNNMNLTLTSNDTVDPTGLVNPMVAFRLRYALENLYDFFRTEIISPDGTVSNQVGAITGTDANWSYLSYPAGVATPFRIRFRTTSDVTVAADGAYLDDVAVVGEQAQNVLEMPGELTFPYWQPTAVGRKNVRVQITNPGQTTVLEEGTVPVTSREARGTGRFGFLTGESGVRDVYVKAEGYLRRRISNVNLVPGMGFVTGTLVIGDVNDDNAVNQADFDLILARQGSTPSSANWDARCDLDGNNIIDLRDYRWAFSNRNRVGD